MPRQHSERIQDDPNSSRFYVAIIEEQTCGVRMSLRAWRRILTRSSGATADLATPPATPPATSSRTASGSTAPPPPLLSAVSPARASMPSCSAPPSRARLREESEREKRSEFGGEGEEKPPRNAKADGEGESKQ